MATFPNLRRHHEDRPRPRFGPSSYIALTEDIPVEKLAPLRLSARPQAHVDTPQVRRTEWVRACGGPLQPLGKLPKELRVGIIGGGAAGVRTAFEAVKAGSCNVTLIEARHEVGGRARSVPMGNKNIGELGSMRFPPSEGDLYDLAEKFGYGFISGFPDPGIVPTLVSYEGHCEVWDNPKKVPAGFETVASGWAALVHDGFNINGKTFESPTVMATWLQSDIDVRMKVQKAWQEYINEFKNDTFLYGMQKIFSPSNKTPPGGKNWTTDDFDRFGKLGIGSGGFGAFFKQCFLSIMRLMPNLWDLDQGSFVKFVHGKPEPAGIRELWQSVYDRATENGLKTLLKTKATKVSKQPGLNGNLLYTVSVEYENGETEDLQFDELFCNVTNNVATVDLDLGKQIFSEATHDAMEAVHMVLTTKLFVKVSRKPYFDDEKFPRVLLTDGNLPQAYCLDYGDPENIVVLLVYAWEEYSERLQAQQDPQQLFESLRNWAAEAVANSTAYNNWADCLKHPVSDIQLHHWQNDPTARGAFTLALPGQDRECATLFYDFEKKEGPYLIGDSFSFGGGWTESALETAFNCFSAMLQRRGELYHPKLAPVNLISSTTYTY